MANIFSLKKPLVNLYYKDHSEWEKNIQTQQESDNIDSETSAGVLRLTYPLKYLKPPELKPDEKKSELRQNKQFKKQFKLAPAPPKPTNLVEDLIKNLEATFSELLDFFGFTINSDHLEVQVKKPLPQQKMPNDFAKQIQEVFNQLARQKQAPVRIEETLKTSVKTINCLRI